MIICKQCYVTHYNGSLERWQQEVAYTYYRMCGHCLQMADTKHFYSDMFAPTHHEHAKLSNGRDRRSMKNANNDVYTEQTGEYNIDYVGWSVEHGVKGFMCRGCGKCFICKAKDLPADNTLQEVDGVEGEEWFARTFGRMHGKEGAMQMEAITKAKKEGKNAMMTIQAPPIEAPQQPQTCTTAVCAPPPAPPVQSVQPAPVQAAPVEEAPAPKQLPVREDITPEHLHAARQILNQVCDLTRGIDGAVAARQQLRDTIAILVSPYQVRDVISRGDGLQDTLIVTRLVGGDRDNEYYKVYGRVLNMKTKRIGKKQVRIRVLEHAWKKQEGRWEGKLPDESGEVEE